MGFRHGKPITVVRGGGLDDDADPTPPTAAHVIEGCSWASRTAGAGPSTAPLEDRGREGVRTGRTLYLPPGSDINHDDQVVLGLALELHEVDGHELWNVDGSDDEEWANPKSGRRHGIEVAIWRAEG